jgi:hypothetical protein
LSHFNRCGKKSVQTKSRATESSTLALEDRNHNCA